MDIENAANILAGSILTGLAVIIAVIVIVIVNNILSKYWKPVQWIKFDEMPKRFATPEELSENKVESKS
jgi:hypothetical protein